MKASRKRLKVVELEINEEKPIEYWIEYFIKDSFTKPFHCWYFDWVNIFYETIINSNEKVLFYLDKDDKIVGMICYCFSSLFAECVFINNIDIALPLRNKGLGKQIYNKFEKYCLKKYKKIDYFKGYAISEHEVFCFWRSLGFAVYPSTTIITKYIDKPDIDVVRMSEELNSREAANER